MKVFTRKPKYYTTVTDIHGIRFIAVYKSRIIRRDVLVDWYWKELGNE